MHKRLLQRMLRRNIFIVFSSTKSDLPRAGDNSFAAIGSIVVQRFTPTVPKASTHRCLWIPFVMVWDLLYFRYQIYFGYNT